ncbi:ribonuclease BN-like protein [Syntrophotalea acetylenivorans]|uniref:Ribonuclease BN-like protein n=1 Tax=Syntrophotalea acetylenivorans TaxID=1842532 RepID=A0A1L3GKS6_9BACT|nr:YihY/virulence factor BrkB family protein [Syntrophotalea acetylenivorans]APG26553.1 ribonuclease BN-like protein [Syntrophotalea acetylenivorans]
MSSMKSILEKVRKFLIYDLWRIDPHELTRWRVFWLRQAQIFWLVVRDFTADNCMLRASALTYATLLSIVPLLALMFSLLKGLGVQNVLEPFLINNLAIGSQEVVGEIFRYIENTQFGRLGAIGLIVLVLTVLALLSNIEKSFNHIWRVHETRTLMRRFADYFSVVLLSPLLILAAVSISTSLQSQTLVLKLLETAYVGEALLLLFKLIPFVVMWAAFIFLYLFMPNTRVRIQAALVGGIVGGTLWQLLQWGYVHFQVGVGKYNAIYGTMAALPIFIVWLYLSWMIVLFGVELTYAIQNIGTVRQNLGAEKINFLCRQQLALTILILTGEIFYRGEPAWGREQIGEDLKLPPRVLSELLDDMVRLNLMAVLCDESGEHLRYQPGRALDALTVQGLFRELREDGATYPQNFRLPTRELVNDLEVKMQQAEEGVLGELTVQDLVLQRVAEKEKQQGEG